jgi:hypothetical protein
MITALVALPALAQTPATSETTTAPASTPAKTDKEQEEEAQKKLTAQALELLDAVIKDSERLTLPQNRAYLNVTAAELIWPYDEQGALSLFKNAMADLRAMMSEPDMEEMPRGYRQKMERAMLREKLLFAVARHDGRLAQTYLAETRPTTQPKKDAPPYASEEEFEARLATVIAQNDPTQALDMARRTLAKGFSYNLPNLLLEIQKKDAEAAAQLAADMLTKLKTITLTSNQEASNVAVRLLQMATEAPPQGKKDFKPLLSEQSLRELAELIVNAALNISTEAPGYVDYSSVMAQLEKYAPARTQQLKRKDTQNEGEEGEGEGDEGEQYVQYQKLMESGDVDALLAAAEKAEPGLREAYYRQAAFKLVNDGQSDRARQLITEHVTDADQRRTMLAELDKQTLAASASQGKLDETRRYLSRASTNEERIAALAQLATAVAQKGDRKVALQLLEEARTLSPGRARYSRQLLAQLQIARSYAAVDPAQSFAILEPSIDQLNELIAAGILLGEFFGEEEVIQNDELVIQPFVQMVESFQQQYGKDLSLLARANFTRTQDAAEKFQRYEVRLLARLLVAQSVLTPRADEKSTSAPETQNVRPLLPNPVIGTP